MLSIGRVASGQAAVAYFTGGPDARAAGCGVGYYARDEAAAGRWVGSGAAALGLVGELDRAGVRVLAVLLDGVGLDGARLVEPVLRADPAGRVPALPIVTAARAAAADAGTDLPVLLGSELYRHWHTAAKTLGGGSKGRGIRADVAAAIARRCGLEAAGVYEANTAGGGDAFRAALARAGSRVDGRRAGLDLTFSAPKSVSLLAAFAPGAVAEQVRAAHDAAVTEAVGWLEPRVARAARGHHGDGQMVARVRSDGLVGVAFAHDVSRALDPQLHTHVVLANLARAGDGRWSALDTKAAYRHSRTAGHLYQAVLRAELTARLGVGWGPVTRGTAEIAGVSARLRRVFSKRSDAIAHQLYRAGLEGPRAAQAACLASRDLKTHIDPQELQRRWRAEAAAAKVDPDTVVAEALGQSSPPAADDHALAERLLGPSGLIEQRTWFDDLLQAMCTHLPAGALVDAPTVERLSARVLAHPDTIPLNTGEQPRWTTRDLLEVEQHALATADRLHHLPAAPVDPLLVEHALRAHGLTGEQADLVRTLTQHPGRLSVVVGPAGAGRPTGNATPSPRCAPGAPAPHSGPTCSTATSTSTPPPPTAPTGSSRTTSWPGRCCTGPTTCSCSPPPAPTPPTSTPRSATPSTPPDTSAPTSSTSTPSTGPAATPPATRSSSPARTPPAACSTATASPSPTSTPTAARSPSTPATGATSPCPGPTWPTDSSTTPTP